VFPIMGLRAGLEGPSVRDALLHSLAALKRRVRSLRRYRTGIVHVLVHMYVDYTDKH